MVRMRTSLACASRTGRSMPTCWLAHGHTNDHPRGEWRWRRRRGRGHERKKVPCVCLLYPPTHTPVFCRGGERRRWPPPPGSRRRSGRSGTPGGGLCCVLVWICSGVGGEPLVVMFQRGVCGCVGVGESGGLRGVSSLPRGCINTCTTSASLCRQRGADLCGGRSGEGEVGQLRPELHAARVGVDVEDDEGFGLCVTMAGNVWIRVVLLLGWEERVV